MHLFAVGEDGRVYTARAAPDEKTWHGWTNVSEGAVFSQGATVSALRDTAGEMHLFAVGEDGRAYTARGTPGQGEKNKWSAIKAGVFHQGTIITSLLDAAGEMHLFAVGEDGRVYTAYAKPGQDQDQANWIGWGPVARGVFHQGATASALLAAAGEMHLYAVGENGRAYTTHAKPGEDWPDWEYLSADGVFK
jgi:hypothetical protein